MSFQANRRQSQPDDGGYALPIVIVVIAVGAMVAIALLGYAAALLRAGEDDADSLLHLYAADAGITRMKERLEEELDPDPIGFMFGDIEVKVEADHHPSNSVLPLQTLTPQPIDPRVPVPATLDETYPITIQSVPSGWLLDVRWEYSTTTARVLPSDEPQNPPYTSPSIKVEAEGTPIATSESCEDYQQDDESLGCLQVRNNELGAGNIDIVFDPGTEEWVSTRPGRGLCPNENGKTLCVIPVPAASSPNADQALGYLPALQEDYIVVSTSGDTTVTAYIRQIPGWCLDDSSYGLGVEPAYERCDDVKILSWKPYPPNSDDEP